jgi:uncharacterized protein (AIM24 family)
MPFEKINSKMVKARVGHGQQLVARKGAMLLYSGDVRFEPLTMGGAGGMGGFAGRVMSGEHVAMMGAQGEGEVHYGYRGLHVDVVNLDGSATMSVEANRLLAYEGYLQTSVVFLGQQGGLRGAVRGAMTGQGLFTTQIAGQGSVAVLSHGGMIGLAVDPSRPPVVVDPQSYVGHVGQLAIDISARVGWRDAVGRGSGEAIQLKVTGHGTVFVQASEQKF